MFSPPHPLTLQAYLLHLIVAKRPRSDAGLSSRHYLQGPAIHSPYGYGLQHMLGLWRHAFTIQTLCEFCVKETSQSGQAVKAIKSYIKKVVEEGVRSLLPGPSGKRGSACLKKSVEISPKPGAVSSGLEVESDFGQEDLEPYSFDFSLVPTFISAVKQAIE